MTKKTENDWIKDLSNIVPAKSPFVQCVLTWEKLTKDEIELVFKSLLKSDRLMTFQVDGWKTRAEVAIGTEDKEPKKP